MQKLTSSFQAVEAHQAKIDRRVWLTAPADRAERIPVLSDTPVGTPCERDELSVEDSAWPQLGERRSERRQPLSQRRSVACPQLRASAVDPHHAAVAVPLRLENPPWTA